MEAKEKETSFEEKNTTRAGARYLAESWNRWCKDAVAV